MADAPVPAPFRVLFFTTTSEIGGAERSFCNLAGQFAEDGWEVRLASLEPAGVLMDAAREAGLQTFAVGLRKVINPVRLAALYRFLRKARFDVVLVTGLRGKLCLLPLAALAGVPVRISAVRGLDAWKRPWHVWLERLLHPLTTCWIANSHAAKDWVVSCEGVPADRVYVIHQGLTVHAAHTPARSGNEPFTIGVLANIRSGKGHGFLIDALGPWLRSRKDVRVQFIGKDYSHGRIQELIREQNLDQWIQMTGFVAEVGSYLKANVDLMVLPSYSESFPSSLIEGMFVGVPIVATRQGGIPELLRHGETGWLIEPGDTEGLLSAVQTLRQDAALRKRLAAAARQDAESRLTLGRSTAQYERLFEKYLNRGESPA